MIQAWIEKIFTKPGVNLIAIGLVIIMSVSTIGWSSEALAAHPPGTCTHDPQFDIPYAASEPGSGLISAIVTDIKGVVYASAGRIFVSIYYDNSFGEILAAAVAIYIAIYGILFTFGMVQLTVYDFFIRAVKLGIIAGLISQYFWTVWYDLVLFLFTFFDEGTDDIIMELTSITVGGVAGNYDPDTPFAILDQVIATAVSAKMAVTILAVFFTGPYGVIFGILLLLSLGSFLRALFTAIWVYLMAVVLRALLIGLSPVFLAFLLFTRTRHLFDGWLNQLVNASLQPIFLFTFFAFFVALILASMENILANPVCWTEWIDSVRGTPFAVHYWRFALWNDDTGTWEPYGGLRSWAGVDGEPDAPVFPIDVMHILIFLMLAELASRFNHIIIMIASDIAGASTNLATMQGPLAGWLGGGGGGRNNSLAGGPGYRGTPGGVNPAMQNWQQTMTDKGGLGTVAETMERMRGMPGKR